ncbi:hypothetical protein NPIL_156651 [Nephila pilipes]|uniref:Uncharacterized protein n=1 Tax=Nephila pilipes TaxID=299642 RepID=A0A8X6NGW1_NEPPI|nr:hypothetical protein NPIL_156651 [Nephila pilipes]
MCAVLAVRRLCQPAGVSAARFGAARDGKYVLCAAYACQPARQRCACRTAAMRGKAGCVLAALAGHAACCGCVCSVRLRAAAKLRFWRNLQPRSQRPMRYGSGMQRTARCRHAKALPRIAGLRA